jgi:hypothetical protein
LALNFLSTDPGKARNSLQAVRKCFNGSPSLLWQQRIDARAFLILKHQFDFTGNSNWYTDEFLVAQLGELIQEGIF